MIAVTLTVSLCTFVYIISFMLNLTSAGMVSFVGATGKWEKAIMVVFLSFFDLLCRSQRPKYLNVQGRGSGCWWLWCQGWKKMAFSVEEFWVHTWYLSQAPQAVLVEKNLSCGEFFPDYAVLSQNLFCRDLRAFVWRKIEPKIVLVEKKDKYQVSPYHSKL